MSLTSVCGGAFVGLGFFGHWDWGCGLAESPSWPLDALYGITYTIPKGTINLFMKIKLTQMKILFLQRSLLEKKIITIIY